MSVLLENVKSFVETLDENGYVQIPDESLQKVNSVFSGISETDYQKKREMIADALCQETKKSIGVCQEAGIEDILYDEKRVFIVKVDTFEEYYKECKKYIASDQKDTIYFRGQSNINWAIQPSIFRDKNWIDHEKDFIQEMIIRNPADFEHCRTTIEKLTKMQHYNAPTRLLDLTKNRFIALFFACEKSVAETGKPHGEVVMFRNNSEHIYYYDSDTVAMLANIAMMDTNFYVKSKKLAQLNYLIKLDRPHFGGIYTNKLLKQCVITHAKLDNKRIMNQHGLFLLVGAGADRSKPADIDPYFLKDKDNKNIVFIIPYGKKGSILEELEDMNFNKGFIYPEIDKVADYLKNEVFKPKTAP